MKILFLFHRNLETATGGVVEFLHQLPLALKKLRIESVIYTQTDKHTKLLSGPRELPNGARYYSGPFLNPGAIFKAQKLQPILELCLREKIDILHAQTTYRAGYLAMEVNKKNNIPYVITSHNDILTTNSPRMKKTSVQRRCKAILKNATAVTHLTSLMAAASHQLYNTENKDFVIGNGVDLKTWRVFRNQPEKDYMLTIGRLEIGKGFDVLIDAFAKLQRVNSSTKLVIAGDGAARNLLEQQAQRLNLTNIIFTGYVKGDEKKRLYAEAKIILFATQPDAWAEAFSLVQLEAMASGKAMIASDTDPTRYLQTLGLETQLVPAKDTNAWADAMHILLCNTQQRHEAAAKNLQASAQFDWEMVAKQYAEAYSSIVL